jgi:hypothetical protein
MTLIPLAITTICYLWVAAGFYAQGNGPLAVAFLFYACANGGFMWAAAR